ncbi:bacillithiol biosynthesis cysteine-adding enzyme BshC [Nafulsella turpanensis]|uniref:bacillithiol biosynthesis cysteine-adding enzyme BshC n=1 Tax=Nafulsella turpanensis TaxID=1265690 RepID=UPI0003492A85|nr:bacillithiol biosynthesis cysteine-adding enzyme BshC [Nafulsella turpanensis]
MRSEKIELDQLQQFSPLFLDYLKGKPELKSFYHLPPSPASFQPQIQQKQFSSQYRANLQEVLIEQYSGLPTADAVQENIRLLGLDNTFTVTTGHQLNIFTGPLYFIYKIITTINTCRELSQKYPDYHFVPVYWMASEDHDFEEINNFRLFGKEYRWESSQKGPVGAFSPNGLSSLLKELPESLPVFEKAYTENKTLSAATRQYVHELFAKEGLLVLDASHPKLKASFTDIIKADLLENQANRLVEEQSARLKEMGYKDQVFPREINFFYMKPGLRERIVREGNEFKVLNTELTFSEEELLQEVEQHPERFSPNVILRPLYQEWILPNLAYVGGPAEVAYWLQLKRVFDHFGVPFPLLLPRNFALLINKASQHKLEKTGLEAVELFKDSHELKQQLVLANVEQEISLQEEQKELEALFARIQEKAAAVDKSLEGFVGAEAAKSQKSLENIEKRIKKAEERKHETTLSQVDSLKEKLFPDNSLQERKDSFLNFYINNTGFLQELSQELHPFDFRFNILSSDE